MKKVIVNVINDLSTDQRVHKVCETLLGMGFDVELIGSRTSKSIALPKRKYRTKRIRLNFSKSFLFFAQYNLYSFFYLLFHRFDLIVANDLDTLLASWLAAKIKGKPIVYDTHEYYCGTPELVNRPGVQNFWRRIERFIFPRLTDVITVNESIADLYEKEYQKPLHIVRNIPKRQQDFVLTKTRKDLQLPENKTILIFQGAGINMDRGVEELVQAMQFVHENIVLLIVGSGTVIHLIKQLAKDIQIEDRVIFVPRVPLQELRNYTQLSDFGLTVDKDTNINYRFSLPNKLFDYIRSGLPIIASELTEIKKIITHYDIGTFIKNHQPQHIAEVINKTVEDEEMIRKWKENLQLADQELAWENEEEVLQKIYRKYV